MRIEIEVPACIPPIVRIKKNEPGEFLEVRFLEEDKDAVCHAIYISKDCTTYITEHGIEVEV